MRLSRACAYALSAVLQLADAPRGVPIPCSKLARLGEMPERFLLQVLRSLVTHSILSSTRGVEGGYSLARPLDQITLLQLLEATDGPLGPVIPPLESIPQQSRGNLEQILVEVTARENRFLGGIKLSDLHPTQRIHEQEFRDEQPSGERPEEEGLRGKAI